MSSSPVPLGTNVTVLVGTLSRPPSLRPLRSGDLVLDLEVTVRPDDGPAESVPVAWYDPPEGAASWILGEELLITGRTRRRFFRVGGQTQSRTEVVADVAVPARRSAAVRRAVSAAVGGLCPPGS